MTDLVEDIKTALTADPFWDGDENWIGYYTRLPVILKDRLDRPATMEEVITCNYLWVRFLLDRNAPKALYAFLELPQYKDLISLFGDPAARMRRRLQNDLHTLALFASGKVKFLSAKDERDTLIEYGLTQSALRQYDEGALTIRDLLRLCPAVVAPRY